jgi:hypothetical protein
MLDRDGEEVDEAEETFDEGSVLYPLKEAPSLVLATACT